MNLPFTSSSRFVPTLIPGLRSPYERVGGLVHFGRMLDKIRLHRAGKLPQPWVEAMGHPNGLDTACCVFLGVDYARLASRTTADDQPSDDALLAWMFQHGRRPDEHEIQLWSENLMKRGWRDRFSERVRVRLREAALPEDAAATLFDFIELDEGRPLQNELPL